RRCIDLLDARRNQLFAPIGWLLLWTTQLALAIEAWRAACGPHVADWLAAAGELEALCALGGYAREHPQRPFPTIREGPPPPDGRGPGPPLLLASRCVPHAVR